MRVLLSGEEEEPNDVGDGDQEPACCHGLFGGVARIDARVDADDREDEGNGGEGGELKTRGAERIGHDAEVFADDEEELEEDGEPEHALAAAVTGFGGTLSDEGDDPSYGAEQKEDGEDLVGKDEPAWMNEGDVVSKATSRAARGPADRWWSESDDLPDVEASAPAAFARHLRVDRGKPSVNAR